VSDRLARLHDHLGGQAQSRSLRGSDDTNTVAPPTPATPTDGGETTTLATPAEGSAVELPYYVSLPIITVLVLFSGLFSGLTLGLMGLDVIGLQIVEKGDNKELARCAASIAPVRENGNLLLCTLLLGNVAVNSAVSVLTAQISSGLTGFFVSTTLIVIFGEILPQACCSRYALQVGARTVPIVKVLICLFYLCAKPMSIVLDWLLGQEVGMVLDRSELLEMLNVQISLGALNPQEGEMAKQAAEGAISLRDTCVEAAMIPFEDMYTLSAETRLGYCTIREIFETGYSRIPVYGKHLHDYVGLLYTKDLMLADPEDEMRLGDFIAIFHRTVESFFKDTKLHSALNSFKKGGTHMGLVRLINTEVDTAPRFEIAGLLTLEDIMEEIIQAEIIDETDVYVDVDNRIKVNDGRESAVLDLGVFDPVWKTRCGDRLSRDEISAVAAHLRNAAFPPGSEMELSVQAVEYLVATSQVCTQKRVTQLGLDDVDQEDFLFKNGSLTDCCTLVLQGRVTVVAGRDRFRSEAGAFSILATDALCPHAVYCPDFSAHLSTAEVRFLSIPRGQFIAAQSLDKDSEALQTAWCAVVAFSSRDSQRSEARLRGSPKRSQSIEVRKEVVFSDDVTHMPSAATDAVGHCHSAGVVSSFGEGLASSPLKCSPISNRSVSFHPTLLTSGVTRFEELSGKTSTASRTPDTSPTRCGRTCFESL